MSLLLWLTAQTEIPSEIPATRTGGGYLPPIYKERDEEQRRKRIKDRENRLDEIVNKAWRKAKGIVDAEVVAEIPPPPAQAKVTPSRAQDFAARLVELRSEYPQIAALDAMISRIQREAIALEQMMEEAAAIAAQIEEEAIVLLLS